MAKLYDSVSSCGATAIGIALLATAGCTETREEPALPGETTASGTTPSETEDASTAEPESTDAGPDSDSNSNSNSGPLLDVGSAETEGDPIDSDTSDACEENIDIVFVMDVSTTMGPFLGRLAEEILVVDQAVADLEMTGEARYGLVVFVDDFALVNAGAAYDDATALQADFQMWSTFTSSNSQVSGMGSNGTFPENSLDALHVAASAFGWRPADTTLRIVIHTTDDTFWDGPTTQDGVMIEHGYEETVAALQASQIRVFSFADSIGGACACEDVTPGWSTPYEGGTSIPEATDGGVFDIGEVLAGTLSLSEAITESVSTSVCDPYEPVG